MRILYVCGDMGIEVGGRKGASTHVRETCHALIRRGHEVLVVTPAPGEQSQVMVSMRKVDPPTAKWLGFDARYMLLDLKMRRELRRVAAEFQPDAIYERYSLYQRAGAALARELALPRILEVNTFLARELSSRLKFPWLAERVERRLWRRERAIVVVSDTLKRMMIEQVQLDESKMAAFEVSPVAVNPEVFSPETAPAREPLEFARGQKLVGYVGTLTAWHGVDLFFEAARLLKEGGHRVAFYAVGGPEQRAERFQKKAQELELQEHLRFAGSIPFTDVPATLAAMDVCVIPDTQNWSSPTKYFEFAAMRRPVVGARSPATEEVFGSGAEMGGLLFERGDARGMVDCILELLDNPEQARALGETARRRVMQKYTWDSSVRLIEEIYGKMRTAAPGAQAGETAEGESDRAKLTQTREKASAK